MPMGTSSPRFPALAVFACAMFFAPKSSAEGVGVHWDVSLQAGVMQRWTDRNTPSVHPLPGPSGQLAAHVALLPLVHVGGYFGADVSPYEGGGLRNFEYGGLHTKVVLPFLPKSMRLWVTLGFGVGRRYESSFRAANGSGTQRFFGPDEAAFLEVPLGVGASYKFWPGWSVFGELGGRVLMAGSSGDATSDDRFGVGLSIGIILDR